MSKKIKISSISIDGKDFQVYDSGNFVFGENDFCFGINAPKDADDFFFESLKNKEFKIEFQMSPNDCDWVLKTVFYDELGVFGKIWYNTCKLFKRIFK